MSTEPTMPPRQGQTAYEVKGQMFSIQMDLYNKSQAEWRPKTQTNAQSPISLHRHTAF